MSFEIFLTLLLLFVQLFCNVVLLGTKLTKNWRVGNHPHTWEPTLGMNTSYKHKMTNYLHLNFGYGSTL